MAKTVTLIATTSAKGAGKVGDPYRVVYELWTLDGSLICSLDGFNEEGLVTRAITEVVSGS